MKSIRWRKEEYLDIGHGFTAVVESYTTLDGLVMKAYVYKGLRSEDMILVTSVMSPNYDNTYLLSQVVKTLSNQDHIEKIWKNSLEK